MRMFVILALTAISLIGCSHSPAAPSTSTGPSTSTAPPTFTVVPQSNLPPGTNLWHATSTVVGVSATLNDCPVDHVVGQTRNVDWAIGPGEFPKSPSSIGFWESPDQSGDCGNPQAPCYSGSRTGDQFAVQAAQDGEPTCFVGQGDLTGSFSADGRTFDAVENIMYIHFGKDDMTVSRHWTGTLP